MTSRNVLCFVLAVGALVPACTVDRVAPDAATPMDTNMVVVPDAGPPPVDAGQPECDAGLIACGGTCTRVAADSNNCGSCGNVCPRGTTCAVGRCDCEAPRLSCDGLCIDLQTDAEHCGTCDHPCPSTDFCSLGECVMMCDEPGHRVCVNTDGAGVRTQVCADLTSDPYNCGTCNTRCGGGSSCVDGVCLCPGGGVSCGGGCVDVRTDIDNCGTCLNSCGAGGTCAAGACTVCGTDLTRCGTPARCFDTTSSTLHCGMCGHACPGGGTCNAGTCECPASTPTVCTTGTSSSCNDTMTSTQHCGMCNHACASGGICVDGVCACPDGQTQCGSVCRDLMTTATNCGMCGRACSPGGVCIDGACACPGTAGMVCGGRCVDTATSAQHCGTCGHDCGPGGACVDGACTCMTGLMLCDTACAETQIDSLHCGDCTTVCGPAMGCHAGHCESVDTFRITGLDATGCAVIDHQSATGDDRGGIGITSTNVLITGDTSTARLSASDLSHAVALGVVHDGLISNIDSERAYTLRTAANAEFSSSTATITQLGVLDTDGVLTSQRIPLSMPIPMASQSAIMSGYGEALIGVPVAATGSGPTLVPAHLQWWQIELPSGAVTQLGTTPGTSPTTTSPTHRGCEGTSTWFGIAERSPTGHSVVYVESTTVIARLDVPNTGVSTTGPTPLATFTNLGDMCSIAFSTSRNRWYFHHEYDSQFGGLTSGETAGYCPGAFTLR